MSCLYCWNQPKKYGRYDLILDGKISAKDITITNGTGTDFVSLAEKLNIIDSQMGFMHSYDDTYKSFNELLEAFHQRKLKEHVVYLVPNENTSSYKKDVIIGEKVVQTPVIENGQYVRDEQGNLVMEETTVSARVDGEEIDRYEEEIDEEPEEVGVKSFNTEDKYDEYMIIKGQLELIGSGSYQRIRQDIEAITGYGILHDWDGVNINQNDDQINDLNTRLNRDRVIFEKVTGYDYLDSKNNPIITPEDIDNKVEAINKTVITGDSINARINRDREILKAITGYVNYEDEEDDKTSLEKKISDDVQNDGGTIKEVVSGITGYVYDKDPTKAQESAQGSIKDVVKAITGYPTFNMSVTDEGDGDGSIVDVVKAITGYNWNVDTKKDSANGSIKDVVKAVTGYTFDTDVNTEADGHGSIKDVIKGITGYIYEKDATKDDAKANIKTVIENITGYNFHKDSSVTANGGNITEVVAAITGYDFNTDVTTEGGNIDDRIKTEIKDRTDADTLISETVASITGYDFDKDVTTEGGNIHTRIVNEITRATAAEETLDKKIDDTKTALQKEIDDDVKVETDRAILKEEELEGKITVNADDIKSLTDTITELRKNIVILELDKGYQITAPTIEASYEEGTLSTASIKDFSITSENLVIGDNEVAVKFSGFDIEGVEYPFNVEHNFNVIVDDFGEVKFENPVIIPVEITDTITKPEVDEETGDIIQIDTTVPVILGSITLNLTGNHKKQTLGINYNIESVSYDTNNETV